MYQLKLIKLMKISNIVQILAILVIASYSLETGQQIPQCPAVVVPCQQKQEQNPDKPTILTYYIESNVQQSEDYIEMSLTIKQKDTSLKKAIDKLSRKVQSIKALFQEYCRKNKGENCESRVEVDKFNVQPSYQIVRRQPIFNGFVVTHVIKITVIQTANVGDLVDSLLGLGIYQIDQLEWKADVEVDSTEVAIDTGINKGNELCRHINRVMGTILSIEEVFFEADDKKSDDGDNDAGNDEEQEDENEPTMLEFKIECVDDQSEKISKRKKAEVEKSEKKKKKK